MERESNPMEALCRSGCGFYGNPSTDGLCSVCFKEALKKKQQPPASTPSAVSSSFVAAPAPAPAATPLAAAAPTVPSLPQPHQHADRIPIMENDPSKKESKGKRILKKALRRNSKSSNNSQNSPLDLSIGSRSKSFENKRMSVEINDSTPLPTPDGTSEKAEHSRVASKLKIDDKPAVKSPLSDRDSPASELRLKKNVDINEDQNTVYDAVATASSKDKHSPRLDKNDPEVDKKSLKRKFEEESGAGTSGASTGASDTDADDKDPSKDKKKKNRCAVCRKKVGLTGFECRCGGLFCAVHRYSDKHECSFDYRELGAQEIRRNNPVVVSQKIHKI